MKTKSEIRTHYLRIRHEIPEHYRQQAAASAAVLLAEHPIFKQSQHIACYWSHNNEFETIPLIHTIWREGKKCYLPVLGEGKTLLFVRYEEGDELEANQFGILEPYHFSRKIPPEKLDMVIMPLVAYDSQGRRLGMGGGYYDRSFAFAHAHHHIHFVGLAYTAQHADELPADPWDINLNSIITEKGIRSF